MDEDLLLEFEFEFEAEAENPDGSTNRFDASNLPPRADIMGTGTTVAPRTAGHRISVRLATTR